MLLVSVAMKMLVWKWCEGFVEAGFCVSGGMASFRVLGCFNGGWRCRLAAGVFFD